MDDVERAASSIDGGVRGVECFEHRDKHAAPHVTGRIPTGPFGRAKNDAEVLTVDVLHHHEVAATHLANIVRVNDVGMAQHHRQPCLI